MSTRHAFHLCLRLLQLRPTLEFLQISTYKLEDHSQLVSGYWTHSANVVTLAFSPDGKYLVSGGLDGNISFWYHTP